ncbi:uncharacterized protein LOC128643545 isoform X2 [Bombina bombina]|uniref:uncharacterized protein LOC128643545 isoform X2 n=1 Tax=Bombina bombina TaxID=8345 RepID=UPI00235AB080|nr:uncharacterized protein LOC128643545 isoform X2 [Bombina bombina]
MSLILGLHRAPRKLFAYSALPAIECQICNIFHSLLQFTGSNSADVVCASETEVGEREEKAIKQDASHHDLCVKTALKLLGVWGISWDLSSSKSVMLPVQALLTSTLLILDCLACPRRRKVGKGCLHCQPIQVSMALYFAAHRSSPCFRYIQQ